MKLLSKGFISQSTDFHFAKYRFPFRKVQIFISQSTDFHFEKYRFPFRKVQIHFAKYRFHFVKVQISFRFAGPRLVFPLFYTYLYLQFCHRITEILDILLHFGGPV